VFSNTAPDQTVTLTQGGATTITGTYPNFTITSTDTTYTAGGGIGLTTTEFSVAAGSGLTQDADGLSHADTSSQASIDNTGATFVQDINLDGFGHVTGAASVTVTPSLIGAPQNDGTGATGTWSISISGNANNVSGTVSVSNGGTGATTDSQARTNLGLAIGSNVQAWDANLDQIAALAPTADNFIVGNGTSWTLETPAQALESLGVTATAAELNYVDGVTSPIQTQLNAKGPSGGGTDGLFFENDQTMTTNYAIAATKNAMSTGPITINSGVTLTVSSGARYVVI
jgi:hypothetical protein